MKINTKIIILIAASLILTSVVIGFLSVWQLGKTGQMSILQIEKIGMENIERIKAEGEIREKSLRNELISQKKEYLKSQVQTTMSVLEKAYKDAQDPEKLKAVYKEQVQNAVNTTYGILEAVDEEQGISLEEKQKKAAELIKSLKYGPDNKDYFWINDMHPRMVMHPYKPELNGKDLSENKDPNGKRLFVEFVNVCREKDQGFVDYYWPKYGADKPQPKLSFVKLFKPWNWVVGTGIYIDDIETLVKNRKAELKNNIKTATLEMENKIQATKIEIQRNIKRVFGLTALVTSIVLIIVLTASFIFTQHNITKPVKRIVEGLNEGTEQVVSASGQVAFASQQLAEGASEQAASIEETSSSLEEMSSMVKQNADNTKEAARLVDISRQSMKTSHKFLKQTKGCMKKISSDGEKTSKLLKNIDEIAFQTNLLALNAAVEAARAGESGAGFAVVADEVRNLAQRAASTAKDTEKLIGTTLENIKEGVNLVASSTEEFYQMGEDAKKVSELFAEISVASQEQSQGIGQINIAVSEMDKVVQQNAANAEESASASEEMNAQAEQMKGFVDDLVALVGSNSKNVKNVLGFRGKASKAVTGKAFAEPVKKKLLVAHNSKEVNSEQIIPMDEAVKGF
jgi:methyl-accepting chemotaxis protein